MCTLERAGTLVHEVAIAYLSVYFSVQCIQCMNNTYGAEQLISLKSITCSTWRTYCTLEDVGKQRINRDSAHRGLRLPLQSVAYVVPLLLHSICSSHISMFRVLFECILWGLKIIQVIRLTYIENNNIITSNLSYHVLLSTFRSSFCFSCGSAVLF